MTLHPWVTPYGVMLTLGCVVAWWLARRRAAAAGFDPSHIDLALPVAFIAGAFFAGALGWFVDSESRIAGEAFLAEERRRLYATVFIVLPLLFAYCRMAGLSFRRFADMVAVPALAFMAIVRVGCFLAGCCFGDVSGHTDAVARIEDPTLRRQVQTVPWLSHEEWPWSVSYPADSFVGRQHAALGLTGPDATAALPVHPVQVYETVLLLLAGLAIVRLRPALRRPGSEALAVLGSYAAIGLLLEFLRGDNALVLGPLTVNQLLCIGWLAVASGLVVVTASRAPSASDPSG